MNPNKILRFATMFYSIAASEKLPANSTDLSTVLKNIEQLETYQARIKYAEDNLSHLSSGSSRITYSTKNDTVIKLAKNDKGIAQNEAESNPKMKSKYLNKIYGHAPNHAWLEVDYLDKITEKDFKEMTDLEFEDFGKSIRYGLRDVSGNTDKDKPKKFDEVLKSDIYKEMKEIGEKFKLMPGDLARISSWGCKNGKPILIDSGLTSEVFEDFYEDSSSS